MVGLQMKCKAGSLTADGLSKICAEDWHPLIYLEGNTPVQLTFVKCGDDQEGGTDVQMDHGIFAVSLNCF